MAFDFFQQFNPKNDKEIVEESKVHHLSKMKEFSEESESNIQDWYEDQMASSLFQQFNPKSVKEILEETKEYQLSKMKDFSEELESNIQDWYEERMEYLREHNSYHKVLGEWEAWSPSGSTSNSMGNQIVFYDVEGGDGGNIIDMNTRTHDEIDGGKGWDEIKAGWGNDIISGGQNSAGAGRNGVYYDSDWMYGEDGNDIITAHSNDLADGGADRDQLIGYSGAELRGGSDSDIFTVNTRDVGEGNDLPVKILDFSAEDKLIVNYVGNGSSHNWVGLDDAGWGEEKLFVLDQAGATVAEINPVDMNDFLTEVSSDGMTLTLTGSEFM
jgi:hypothetical protein